MTRTATLAPLTRTQRASMASCIASAMQKAYEAEGEDGDFADAERYLRDDASDCELRDEFANYFPNVAV